MIKNIVFDIGNVLLEFKPKEYFSKMFDNEFSTRICTLMMTSQIWKNYDLGIYNLNDVKEKFKEALPEYKDVIETMLDAWVSILEPIDYTLEKMKSLKQRGYKIYLLSNLNEEAYHYIKKKYTIFNEADGYIVSFKEQLSKPDQAIYQLLCDRYLLKANECIFIDDLKENVSAAITFHMKGIQFINQIQMDQELETILKGNYNG